MNDVIDVKARETRKELPNGGGFAAPQADAAALQRADGLKTVGWISYLLHLIVAVAAVVPGFQVSIALLIVAFVIDLVKKDDAAGMVSGSVNTTAHTIRPAFEFVKTKPGFTVVSSVFLMCLKDRVLAFGDCAVNPNPSAQQLAEIAIASAHTAKVFGIEPRVAMLSYSTGTSGKGADVDVVVEATKIAQEMAPDLALEGPLQYDAAIDPSVAKTKMPDSKVAGKATVFIFPDLNTGNNTYKAVQRAAGAVAIGPVLQGLNKPVNDLSRGCTVPDIVNTVAITAVQAAAEKAAQK